MTLTKKKADQDLYETVFILRPSLEAEEIQKTVENITAVIERSHGAVLRYENMGKKKLAYPVQKEKRGTYILLHLTGGRSTLLGLQQAFRFDGAVMRFMTVQIQSGDFNLADGIMPPLSGTKENNPLGSSDDGEL